MKTLLLVVLDESGSMDTKRSDVIGGYNRFLEEQKAVADECRVSLVKFNTLYTTVYDAADIAAASPLTTSTYTPAGMTALLDAVAQSVRLADAKKMPDERVICLVITDGEENSSRETTRVQVEHIIKDRESRGDWTFTYLGISPENWHKTGVVTSSANAAAYNAHQPLASFQALSNSTSRLRASAASRTSSFYDESAVPQSVVQPLPISDDDAGWKQPHK